MIDDEIIEEDVPPSASQVTEEAKEPEKPKIRNTTSKYDDRQIIYALTLTKGDVLQTAAALLVTEDALRKRIEGNRDIKAAWNLVKTVKGTPPNYRRTMPAEEVRARPQPEFLKNLIIPEHGETRAGPPPEQLAAEVRAQDLAALNDGMLKAGIKDTTVAKLRDLSGISLGTGKFLVTTLDLSHRMMIYQTIQLLEEADFIKQTYLRDMQLSEEDRLGWQREYNAICDIMGKTFDRTLIGTQAMVSLMGGTPKGKGKKGGWQQSNLIPKPVKEDGEVLPPDA